MNHFRYFIDLPSLKLDELDLSFRQRMLKQVKCLVELEKRFCASEADPYGTDASSVHVASDPELYELMSNIMTYFDDDTDVTKHEATNTKLLGPSRLATLPTQSYRQLQA